MSLNNAPGKKNVYFLEGGGALGSYQFGICAKLLESGYHPDWVIGTSIGAINAAIIAGNLPEKRVEKMAAFWEAIASPNALFPNPSHGVLRQSANLWTSIECLLFGQPHFFKPRPVNPWLIQDGAINELSFYDTSPLRNTLENLVDFNLLNEKNDNKVRLTLSAVRLQDGSSAYFDNTVEEITPDHIMASGALPPGFPAIRIKGHDYWDGGLSYITPLSVLFEGKVSGDIQCFMVDLFANRKETPKNMLELLIRKKDLEFANHYRHMIHNFSEIYHFRHALLELCENDPRLKDHPVYQKLQAAHLFKLNIVRFHYRDSPEDSLSKDFEFSAQTLQERYQAGVADVTKALQSTQWQKPLPPFLGVAVHEF